MIGCVTVTVTKGGGGLVFKFQYLTDITSEWPIIQIMTYDYHGYWDGPLLDKRTGHNSPLYALPSEEDPADLWHGLNTDFSMKYWVAGGARKDQLLMGEWLKLILLVHAPLRHLWLLLSDKMPCTSGFVTCHL